jgi:hypothetical protein
MTPKKNTKKAKPKKAAIKKAPPKMKARAKKATPKKVTAKKAAPKKKPARKKSRSLGRSQTESPIAFEPKKGLGARSGGQSGDLQGLSDTADADSESVDELLEEGNAFEAEVVEGVENAPDADEGEVRTHEVPEDDVPDEYTDKDQ